MISTAASGHSAITRDEMRVIVRCGDGSLKMAYDPISYDNQVLDQIRKIRDEMRAWEANRSEMLLDNVRHLLPDVVGTQEMSVVSIADHFRSAALDVYRLMGFEVDDEPYFLDGDHDQWDYQSDVHSLASYSYSRIIREFSITHEAVRSCQPYLEEGAYWELEQAHYLSSAIRPHLLAALEEYEQAFHDYVNRASQVFPACSRANPFVGGFQPPTVTQSLTTESRQATNA